MSARHVFVEHTLNEVLKAYADGYESKTKEPILERTWLVDPFNKVVLFKVATPTDKLWSDVELDSVVWAFVKSKWPPKPFSRPKLPGGAFPMVHVLPNGEMVIDVKWFIDPVRGLVAFRLLVSTDP